jgi:hypothetical protein
VRGCAYDRRLPSACVDRGGEDKAWRWRTRCVQGRPGQRPADIRSLTCRTRCSRSASTHLHGSAGVRRDFSVSDFDGRPACCPFGASTSAATMRPTRSSRSACRMARTRTLCAVSSGSRIHAPTSPRGRRPRCAAAVAGARPPSPYVFREACPVTSTLVDRVLAVPATPAWQAIAGQFGRNDTVALAVEKV